MVKMFNEKTWLQVVTVRLTIWIDFTSHSDRTPLILYLTLCSYLILFLIKFGWVSILNEHAYKLHVVCRLPSRVIYTCREFTFVVI